MAVYLDSPFFNILLAFASELCTVGQKNSFIPFIYNIFGIDYSIEIEMSGQGRSPKTAYRHSKAYINATQPYDSFLI